MLDQVGGKMLRAAFGSKQLPLPVTPSHPPPVADDRSVTPTPTISVNAAAKA